MSLLTLAAAATVNGCGMQSLLSSSTALGHGGQLIFIPHSKSVAYLLVHPPAARDRERKSARAGVALDHYASFSGLHKISSKARVSIHPNHKSYWRVTIPPSPFRSAISSTIVAHQPFGPFLTMDDLGLLSRIPLEASGSPLTLPTQSRTSLPTLSRV